MVSNLKQEKIVVFNYFIYVAVKHLNKIETRENSNDKLTKMLNIKDKNMINNVVNTESSFKGNKISEANKTDHKETDYNNDHSTLDILKKQNNNNNAQKLGNSKNLATSVYFSNINKGTTGSNSNNHTNHTNVSKQINNYISVKKSDCTSTSINSKFISLYLFLFNVQKRKKAHNLI